MQRVNIIGSGLAGLTCAITLAEGGMPCRLISAQDSERAQSVMAEGGINACLDTMGENDTVEEHLADTLRGGVWLADPNAVETLTSMAPGIVTWLHTLGVPFNLAGGQIAQGHFVRFRKAPATPTTVVQRNFGGQKKKRTAYAMASTGKMLMSALIDQARKHEASGMVQRYPHHEFVRFLPIDMHGDGQRCQGVRVIDAFTGQLLDFAGPVVLASGGMSGMLPGRTTGTTQNTGDVTAIALWQGVQLGNLEMIQYHPTTIGIQGKRCLISEAARGEGGRLFVNRDGSPWYFMEEKYPVLKNLMPRDVVSREMHFVSRSEDCSEQVYLDLTGLPQDTWRDRLPDLRDEIIHYLGIDPAQTPVPVEPGIHYFMGGIDVDQHHCTNVAGIYAAGECCDQYHGANRLGGNSLLGAVCGGKLAAQTVLQREVLQDDDAEAPGCAVVDDDPLAQPSTPGLNRKVGEVLYAGMGIVRDQACMLNALEQLQRLETDMARCERDHARCLLAKAMVRCALARKESRGAHYRSDYPQTLDEFKKTSVASRVADDIDIAFREVPVRRNHEG